MVQSSLAPTEVGTFPFTLVVTDSQNSVAIKDLSISITACVPTITNSSPLPAGHIGVSYNLALIGAGCTSGYSFSAQPTDPFTPTFLPPGLKLSANGKLTGTPLTTGTYNFNIAVTDPMKDTGSYPYSLTINPLPTITNPSVASCMRRRHLLHPDDGGHRN